MPCWQAYRPRKPEGWIPLNKENVGSRVEGKDNIIGWAWAMVQWLIISQEVCSEVTHVYNREHCQCSQPQFSYCKVHISLLHFVHQMRIYSCHIVGDLYNYFTLFCLVEYYYVQNINACYVCACHNATNCVAKATTKDKSKDYIRRPIVVCNVHSTEQVVVQAEQGQEVQLCIVCNRQVKRFPPRNLHIDEEDLLQKVYLLRLMPVWVGWTMVSSLYKSVPPITSGV